MRPYLYRLEADFTYQSPHLVGISFCNDWLLIEGGSILVRAGYSWDGCSPKWVLGRWVIGTPDGPLLPDGWRQTDRASLVHDALCQFKREIPITKAQTQALFDQQLVEARWPYRRLYVWAVNVFGPQQFAGDTSPRSTSLGAGIPQQKGGEPDAELGSADPDCRTAPQLQSDLKPNQPRSGGVFHSRGK